MGSGSIVGQCFSFPNTSKAELKNVRNCRSRVSRFVCSYRLDMIFVCIDKGSFSLEEVTAQSRSCEPSLLMAPSGCYDDKVGS